MLKLQPLEAFEVYYTLLEWYCKQFNVKNYLEIGCAAGGLTARIAPLVERAYGVDVRMFPEWGDYLHLNKEDNLAFADQGSDFFFEKSVPIIKKEFDLVLIDGDHSEDQVAKDVLNSLGSLAIGGLIVMHDTLPPDREHIAPELCGTAYKVVQQLRANSSLQTFTFPVMYGITLVGRRGVGFPWS